MYYVPQMYPYSYPYYVHVNTPIYHSPFMSRNDEDMHEPVLEEILAGIKREASAIDFYSRLAKAAPNEQHQRDILYALGNKKAQLKQLTDLYMYFTGSEPVYEMDHVPFHSYREGLQKACETEAASCAQYQNSWLRTQHPFVRDVFLHAFIHEKEHAARFDLLNKKGSNKIKDYGGKPFVINIEEATTKNNTYRTALWTGQHLQLTVMSINVGDDIGLEVHPTTDQFIRIEEGEGLVQMGDSKDRLDFEAKVQDDYAIFIPAGKWHNVINTGDKPMKLYAIYSPPEHPYGTVHETKEIAMAAEEHHHD